MKSSSLLVVGALVLIPVLAFGQGALTPPGAPAPTMKTLDQVEARVPISQPASFPIVIAQAGSYYLTGNITGASNTDGIRISANDVTIDLNGFAMIGAGGNGDGVNVSTALSNITVRNGVLRTWGHQGMNLENASNLHVESVIVSGGGDFGLNVGPQTVIRDSIFSSNAGGGVRSASVKRGIAILNSSANENTGNGFTLVAGATMTNCVANGNTKVGIQAGSGSAVTSCAAYSNGSFGIVASSGTSVTNCGAYNNSADGINVGQACVIKNNSVHFNREDEIQVGTDCPGMGNICTGTGISPNGAGIQVTGSRNRIEGNQVSLSDRGIQVVQPNNVIRNNTVARNPNSGTPANYDIVAGNQVEILLTFIPETITIPATVTLSGDLTGVSGSNGLTITSDNVTVDLAGHALVGIAGSLAGHWGFRFA